MLLGDNPSLDRFNRNSANGFPTWPRVVKFKVHGSNIQYVQYTKRPFIVKADTQIVRCCYMTRHMKRQHQYNSNHSSLHSVAAAPILDSEYSLYYDYYGPELLLDRWIHGCVALPQISVLYCKFCTEFSYEFKYI
jgi:hypothetical protein